MRLSDALRDFDLGNLGRQLQVAALHQDRCRRLAERMGVPDGFPGTRLAMSDVDTVAESLATSERLLAAVVRFLADEGSGRPAPRTEAARATPLAMRRPGSSLGPVVVPMSVEGR
ncbi:MAG: hypothetical protein K2X71_10285 [Methylobacterium sp.]|uniref:hypothetical protein n=1 Tax=Methylobacterium sp. TaxID=409 RepID=UPI00258D295C|nr:hypothetical protein [Methylobacterium sp.]MBY0296413.1 hypothetical protein [Methylobacterium sp.]